MLLNIPALRTVALAAPKKDPRQVLCGVHIKQDKGNYLLEATDGKVMAFGSYSSGDCGDSEFTKASETTITSLILSNETVDTLLKAKNFGDWARFDAEGGYIVDPTGLNRIAAVNIEGKFPDVKPVVANAIDDSVETHELVLGYPIIKFLADRAKLCDWPQRTITLRLKIREGECLGSHPIAYTVGVGDLADGVVMPVKKTVPPNPED